jgi:hypothetical protein
MTKFFGLLFICGLATMAFAEDQEMPIKADKSVSIDTKKTNLPAGKTLEIKVNNPPVIPMISDLKVKTTGDIKHLGNRNGVNKTEDGKILTGSGWIGIYVQGKGAVTLTYKKGNEEFEHSIKVTE